MGSIRSTMAPQPQAEEESRRTTNLRRHGSDNSSSVSDEKNHTSGQSDESDTSGQNLRVFGFFGACCFLSGLVLLASHLEGKGVLGQSEGSNGVLGSWKKEAGEGKGETRERREDRTYAKEEEEEDEAGRGSCRMRIGQGRGSPKPCAR